MGNHRTPVKIDVLETWELAVLPDEISLKVHPRERIVRTIQLMNLGNMPWDLRRVILAPLSEEDGVHRSLFLSLQNTKGGDYESVLNELVRRLQDMEVEPAQIKLRSAEEVLLPGTSRLVEIEITLPNHLKKHRKYQASASFENARLSLDIEMLENSVPPSQIQS